MKASAKLLHAVILTALLTPGCNREKESVPADSFIGEWYTVRGDFETYSFLKDSNNYIFVATQNLRPVAFGKWKTYKNEFIISIDDGAATTYTFTLRDDTLILNDGEQIYTRTEPPEVRFPEIKILKAISGDLGSLTFTVPKQADLNWASYTDKSGIQQNPSLIGYAISVATTVSSGAFTDICNAIEDLGFEPDPELTTKNCTGFRDDNQVVTVSMKQTGESNNDSITIQITSGYVLK
jgi:hypothetical protein